MSTVRYSLQFIIGEHVPGTLCDHCCKLIYYQTYIKQASRHKLLQHHKALLFCGALILYGYTCIWSAES